MLSMIDERTRTRIILMVWGMCMVALFHLQAYVVGVLIVGVLVAVVVWGWRKQARDAAAQRAGDAAVATRADEQHNQIMSGDEHGVYGDGYEAAKRLQREQVAQQRRWERLLRDKPHCGAAWRGYACQRENGHTGQCQAQGFGGGVASWDNTSGLEGWTD